MGNRFKDSGEIFQSNYFRKDKDYKEHVGVVFDDLRVPNKLTITEIDKVFLNIFKHWNSDQFSILFNHLNYLKIIKFLLFLEGCA